MKIDYWMKRGVIGSRSRLFLMIGIFLFISLTSVAAQENSVTVLGTSLVIFAEDFTNSVNSQTYYYINTEQGDIKLNFLEGQEPKLISGESIRVIGTLSNAAAGGQEIMVQNVEFLGGAAGGEENPNLEEQKTVVLLVNSIDNPIEPISIQEARNRFFNENYHMNGDGTPDSVNSWVQEVSYGKAWLTGDVYGWYTLDFADFGLCYFVTNYANENGILYSALNAANSEVNFMEYDRIIIVFPETFCDFAGMATGGMISNLATPDGSKDYSLIAINGVSGIDNGVVVHELGHNFGLGHANYLDCGNEVIGDQCGIIEYGDPFDLMGGATLIEFFGFMSGHYSTYNKKVVGWLDEENIFEASDDVYLIEPLETMSDGIKSLKVPIPNTENSYYVEYRRPIGYDYPIDDLLGADSIFPYAVNVYDGVFIRSDMGGYGETQLVDMSPLDGVYDTVLRLGESFYDRENDILITLMYRNEDYAEIFLGPPFCGNNEINIGEQCDGPILNGGSCHGLGYRYGSLSCTSRCKFDYLQCSGLICGEGHTFNGNNECTATIEADSNDGSLTAIGFGTDAWSELREREFGIVDGNDNSNYVLTLAYNPQISYLARISFPFNTTLVPDNAIVNSAELFLTKSRPLNSFENTHETSNDFITLVPTSLQNPPHLTSEDFNNFDSVNNPTELANRYDVSDNWNTYFEEKVKFVFNQNGLAYVNKAGFSTFGLRGGYDLFADTPNNGESTTFNTLYYSADSSSGNKPLLIVNYAIPSECGNNFFEPGEQCDDGNLIGSDGCSAQCIVECISQGDLNNKIQQYYVGGMDIREVSFGVLGHLNCF